MRKTFICNESMIITIPIGSLKNIQEGQLMPENFHCVFRDNFKVFVVRGKPKPLGLYSTFQAKLSFSLNIISFFWSLVAFGLCVNEFNSRHHLDQVHHEINVFHSHGIIGLIITLLVFECMMSLFLIYWLSKAVCREHFNTLVCVSFPSFVFFCYIYENMLSPSFALFCSAAHHTAEAGELNDERRAEPGIINSCVRFYFVALNFLCFFAQKQIAGSSV
uniref:Uncharacterized protein n=1 Tax=Poecilia reticulata TaxID=8081 RepID=A0A3P9QAW7_POERE